MQVEDAALAMLQLAGRPPAGPGAHVHHVVHPVETPVERVNDALQRSVPRLRLELVTERPDPTDLERAVDQYGAEATAYLGLRRRYERSSLADLERRRLVNPGVHRQFLSRRRPQPADLGRLTGLPPQE